MDNKLESSLIERYPRIFKLAYDKNFKSWKKSENRGPFSLFGIECASGWYKILEDLCEKMEKCISQAEKPDDYYVVQIKEKFGSLRFYMSSYTVEIHNLITEAENVSEVTCEMCAAPGKLEKSRVGWYQTLCVDCRTKKEAERDFI